MPYDNDAWWQPQKWTQCGMVQQKTIRKCATCGATEQGRAAYGKHYCFECWDTYRTEQDSRRWHDHQPPEQEERQSTATTAAAPVGESGGGGSHLSTAATMEQSSPVVTHASDAPIEAGDNNDQAHTEDGDNPEAGSIKSMFRPRAKKHVFVAGRRLLIRACFMRQETMLWLAMVGPCLWQTC